MKVFDTYKPEALDKYLWDLKLEKHKITKIESPSHIYSAFRKQRYHGYGGEDNDFHTSYLQVEIDDPIVFTLDDGRKIGIEFSSASHVYIEQLDKDYVAASPYADDRAPTISKILSNVVGKTISKYSIDKIDDLDKADDWGWEDAGFDDSQKEFITSVDLHFDDGSRLWFRNWEDFTHVYFDEDYNED